MQSIVNESESDVWMQIGMSLDARGCFDEVLQTASVSVIQPNRPQRDVLLRGIDQIDAHFGKGVGQWYCHISSARFYHVMNREDRREPIFRDEEDRGRLLGTLGEG